MRRSLLSLVVMLALACASTQRREEPLYRKWMGSLSMSKDPGGTDTMDLLLDLRPDGAFEVAMFMSSAAMKIQHEEMGTCKGTAARAGDNLTFTVTSCMTKGKPDSTFPKLFAVLADSRLALTFDGKGISLQAYDELKWKTTRTIAPPPAADLELAPRQYEGAFANKFSLLLPRKAAARAAADPDYLVAFDMNINEWDGIGAVVQVPTFEHDVKTAKITARDAGFAAFFGPYDEKNFTDIKEIGDGDFLVTAKTGIKNHDKLIYFSRSKKDGTYLKAEVSGPGDHADLLRKMALSFTNQGRARTPDDEAKGLTFETVSEPRLFSLNLPAGSKRSVDSGPTLVYVKRLSGVLREIRAEVWRTVQREKVLTLDATLEDSRSYINAKNVEKKERVGKGDFLLVMKPEDEKRKVVYYARGADGYIQTRVVGPDEQTALVMQIARSLKNLEPKAVVQRSVTLKRISYPYKEKTVTLMLPEEAKPHEGEKDWFDVAIGDFDQMTLMTSSPSYLFDEQGKWSGQPEELLSSKKLGKAARVVITKPLGRLQKVHCLLGDKQDITVTLTGPVQYRDLMIKVAESARLD
jgi:hypothetical protein